MKSFDEWFIDYAGCDRELCWRAFKAGMLAAADIAWPDGSSIDSYDIYDDFGAGKKAAAEDIREVING